MAKTVVKTIEVCGSKESPLTCEVDDVVFLEIDTDEVPLADICKKFIEGVVKTILSEKFCKKTTDSCGKTTTQTCYLWTFSFEYDENELQDPTDALTADDILNFCCQSCEGRAIKDIVDCFPSIDNFCDLLPACFEYEAECPSGYFTGVPIGSSS